MAAGCSICLEMYREEDAVRSIRCGHIFHEKCIMEWKARSATCPQCSIKITKLSKIFVSFASHLDLDEMREDTDKEFEIALLSSQLMAAEKAQHDMNEMLSMERSKICSHTEEISQLKMKLKEYGSQSENLKAVFKKEKQKMEAEFVNRQKILQDKVKKIEKECQIKEIELSSALNHTQNEKTRLQHMLIDVQKSSQITENNLLEKLMWYENCLMKLENILKVVTNESQAKNDELSARIKLFKNAKQKAQEEKEQLQDTITFISGQNHQLMTENIDLRSKLVDILMVRHRMSNRSTVNDFNVRNFWKQLANEFLIKIMFWPY